MVVKTFKAIICWLMFSSASFAVTPTTFGQLLQVCNDATASVEVLASRFRDLGWHSITTREYDLYNLVMIDTYLVYQSNLFFGSSRDYGSLTKLKKDRALWLESVGERQLEDEAPEIPILVHPNESGTFLRVEIQPSGVRRGEDARVCSLRSNNDETALLMLKAMMNGAEAVLRGVVYGGQFRANFVMPAQGREDSKIIFLMFDRAQVEAAFKKKLNGTVMIDFKTPASLIEVTP